MKRANLLNLLFWSILAPFLISAEGCGKKDAKTEAPVLTQEARFSQLDYFELTELTSNATSYVLHVSGENNSNMPCRIKKSELKVDDPKTILCWLEAEELDLSFFGAEFKVEAPNSVCEYITYHPYWYWDWQPGTTTQTDNYHNRDTDLCATCNNLPCRNSANYSFTYDHTKQAGPNCDDGTIIENVTSFVPDAAPSTNCSPDGAPVVTVRKGEGSRKNCVGGPGKDFKLDKNGMPIGVIYSTKDGLSETWKIESPILKDLSTNRYIANYTRFCSDGEQPYDIDKLLAYGKNSASGSSVNDPRKHGALPFYVWTCYDRAKEVKGRIYLQIRDWNMSFKTSDDLGSNRPPLMDQGDNPYGEENDIPDWDDFTTIAAPECSNPDSLSSGFLFPMGT